MVLRRVRKSPMRVIAVEGDSGGGNEPGWRRWGRGVEGQLVTGTISHDIFNLIKLPDSGFGGTCMDAMEGHWRMKRSCECKGLADFQILYQNRLDGPIKSHVLVQN